MTTDKIIRANPLISLPLFEYLFSFFKKRLLAKTLRSMKLLFDNYTIIRFNRQWIKILSVTKLSTIYKTLFNDFSEHPTSSQNTFAIKHNNFLDAVESIFMVDNLS